jgi:micrococcal nuclease
MNTLAKLALAALLVASGLVGCSEQTMEKSEGDKAAYVASVIREPFHRPDCKWALKISSANMQTFKTREEAIKAGHRPCKVCRP